VAERLLMGNEAIARGAVEAGLNLATAYPGTPSSEIIGTLAEMAGEFQYYVEWSVNEKVAMEVAAGAAYAGARTLVAMKQVGLNVAGDPLMSLAYIGVKGAMVVVVADDPGPHSSQTEQDTRTYAKFAKLPVFDPAGPREALAMTKAAFEVSRRHGLPVFLRPTTRVCHATEGVEFSKLEVNHPDGFTKDPKWVIFPRLSYLKHRWLEEELPKIATEFSSSVWNRIEPGESLGILTGGVSYLYVKEAAADLGLKPTILKIGTPHPFPVEIATDFLSRVDRVIAVEELDPVLEEAIIQLAARTGFKGQIHGKLSGELPRAGEYGFDLVRQSLIDILKINTSAAVTMSSDKPPELPVRPPVLCAGCSHRASFYAVKRATRGIDAIYTGDIGCYTLGNAPPLSMVDTCLCMGAGITVAQGLGRIEPKRPVIAFIGDSTFFHTGIPGVINAVYNNHPIKIILLDNGATAMTGHQPHPGIGRTAVGEKANPIDPVAVLKACGVGFVEVANPLELKATTGIIKKALDSPGVAAIVMRAPCAATVKSKRKYMVAPDLCTNCRLCIKELGCPAFYIEDKPEIGSSCRGCGLCGQICPAAAIKEVSDGE
jgi:indolepyruvate ferredoxin oxidoreductase alpha subunit